MQRELRVGRDISGSMKGDSLVMVGIFGGSLSLGEWRVVGDCTSFFMELGARKIEN